MFYHYKMIQKNIECWLQLNYENFALFNAILTMKWMINSRPSINWSFLEEKYSVFKWISKNYFKQKQCALEYQSFDCTMQNANALCYLNIVQMVNSNYHFHYDQIKSNILILFKQLKNPGSKLNARILIAFVATTTMTPPLNRINFNWINLK